jgi:hypothetical protein
MPGVRGRVVDLVAKLAEEAAPLVEADSILQTRRDEGRVALRLPRRGLAGAPAFCWSRKASIAFSIAWLGML